jgi:adenylate cyclase, class 2
MTSEVEAKILEINVEETTRKILELGAKKSFEGELRASFFDFQDRSLTNTGRTLRLRQQGEEFMLTFKGPLRKEGKAKVREEHEIRLPDAGNMRCILSGLGLQEGGSSVKHRISYKLKEHPEFGSASLELDTIPDIPTFLEIEAEDEGKLKVLAKELGFLVHELRPWTMTNVIRFYQRVKYLDNLRSGKK